MISPRLQLVAITGSIVFLAMLVILLRKNRLALKYSLLWLFSGFVMLLLSVFPGLLDAFSRMIGVYSSVNALFAMILFCGLILMISITSIVSKQKGEIVRLTQEVSLLENRIRKLENRGPEDRGPENRQPETRQPEEREESTCRR